MADNEHPELLEEVIDIGMHTKVTKGGRTLSFAALVAVGDGRGSVGLGYGKARGVPMAIEKATKQARQNMQRVNLIGDTVAHETVGEHGSARVLLKPASPGTGVKAGATVRLILKVLGVHSVLSKCFGSNNPLNVARATVKALYGLRSVEEMRRLRGRRVTIVHPQQPRQGANGETERVREAAGAAQEQ